MTLAKYRGGYHKLPAMQPRQRAPGLERVAQSVRQAQHFVKAYPKTKGVVA